MKHLNKSGYRLYTQQHLAALKTTRCLAVGYGWQRVPKIMHALHQGDLTTALAVIDARHTELARKRQDCEQTLSALHALAEQLSPEQRSHSPQHLQVGEAARYVGVRVSALHFWEQQGLLHPVRDQSSRYRLYDEPQMRCLRVVVLLREAGYDFKMIHSILNELTAGRPEKAIEVGEKRREELMHTSWICIEALTCFQHYMREFCGQLLGHVLFSL